MGLLAMSLIYQTDDEDTGLQNIIDRFKHLLFVNFHGNTSDMEAGQCNGLVLQ